ncbi:MAG: ATPase P [Desulfonauticus sp.]|nr:ATPase P [Desulfonauticus sp.]
MLKLQIPGQKNLNLSHLVLDYNGTLAIDGKLISGVKERLISLARTLKIHVITADTFGNVKQELAHIPCTVYVLSSTHQDKEKMNYVKSLGSDHTLAIGNGCNDCLMLKQSALGLAVIQAEGAFSQTLLAADIITPDILSALDIIRYPLRLVATLRV